MQFLFKRLFFFIFLIFAFPTFYFSQLYHYNWKELFFAEIDYTEQLVFSQKYNFTKPVLVDINNDQVIDLIIGNKNGSLSLFLNEGSNKEPKYIIKENFLTAIYPNEKNEKGIEVKTIDVGDHAAPTLADFDGDLDLDLLVGNQEGYLWYFENIGNVNNATFRFNTDRFANIKADGGYAVPFVIDFDGNRLNDIFLGSQKGNIAFYENVGTMLDPEFQLPIIIVKGLQINNTAPTIVDWDDDRNFDMISGQKKGQLLYFKNLGNNTNPKWAPPVRLFLNLDLGGYSASSFYIDDFLENNIIVVGNRGQRLFSFDIRRYHDQKVLWSTSKNFTKFNQLINLSKGLRFAAADIDKNGFKDILIGDDNKLVLYSVEGKNSNGNYKLKLISSNILNGLSVKNIAPEFGDLDGDGLLDIIIGNSTKSIYFFKNHSKNGQYKWVLTKSIIEEIDAGVKPSVRLIDYDRDGDLDLFTGSSNGEIRFFRNIGDKKAPVFELDVLNYYVGVFHDELKSSHISFYDWNRDNTFTMFIGNQQNRIFVVQDNKSIDNVMNFKNKKYHYNFSPYELNVWKYKRVDDQIQTYPYFTDLENDGLPELFIGNDEGSAILLTSSFVQRISLAEELKIAKKVQQEKKNKEKKKDKNYIFNSIKSADIKKINYQLKEPTNILDRKLTFNRPVPAFADIDNDGDDDLIIGGADGRIQIHLNQGTAKKYNFLNTPTQIIQTQFLHISPLLLDLDHDRDFDIVFGNSKGEIHALINNGNAFQYEFFQSPLNLLETNFRANAAPALLQSDSPIEILVGNLYGQITSLKQQFRLNDQFIFKKNNINYLDQQLGIDLHLSYNDINLDQSPELVIGNGIGGLMIFEKKAKDNEFEWVRNDKLLPKYEFSKGVYPFIIDLNDDGSNDLIIGLSNREILFFQNMTNVQYK